MTGPSPDAELDEALGITKLPPAQISVEHLRQALVALWPERPRVEFVGPDALSDVDRHQLRRVAGAIADAEARGAARILAEHVVAGAPLGGS